MPKAYARSFLAARELGGKRSGEVGVGIPWASEMMRTLGQPYLAGAGDSRGSFLQICSGAAQD